MTRRPMAVFALVVVLAVSGCAVGYQPASAPDRSPQPSDPPLGYYNGYWHNDTFDLDAEEGLSPGQNAAVISRAMARIQLLRGMRFEADLDIEIITRDEFNEEFDDVWGEPPPDQRLLDNAQYEAMFLVGPDTEVVDVRQTNRGGVVLGFYQPSRERIVIVSGNDPATLDDEITLAHELLHALQDQQFGLASFDGSTLDSINARNGLVEGDAIIVQRAYERNCESGEWECVEADTTGGSVLPPDFHWGVYFLGFFPYAEGPEFVEYHRDRGGWETVNRIYDDIPTASAAIISPETYQTDTYGEATVEDRNGPRWERVTVANGPDAATVGQAGLASMFAYTAYAGDSPGVIDRDQFRNRGSDSLYDYDIEYASGWYADRLHAYERDDRTAYVWNVTFVDEANATMFHDGYERVLEHWHGERQTGEDGTVWTFDGPESRFGGAVWVERDNNAVTVVKAPSASEIGNVYAPAGPG